MTKQDLIDLLILALPYVEEGEEFNNPARRTLSVMIRDTVEGYDDL